MGILAEPLRNTGSMQLKGRKKNLSHNEHASLNITFHANHTRSIPGGFVVSWSRRRDLEEVVFTKEVSEAEFLRNCLHALNVSAQ